MSENGNINDLELAKFIELAGEYGIRVHILHGDSWLPAIANLAALPATGNTTGDIRQLLDTGVPYRWDGASWNVWSTSGTAWGAIAGTLSDQTDLQTALDAKMGSGAYVLVSRDSLLINQINLGALTSGILKQTVSAGVATISILTDNSGNWNTAYTHSQETSGNPHNVTKSEVGLGNVDNTSDANKPVSTAQQTALNLKQDVSAKDATGGYVGLTLFKINFKNVANTFTSFFTNSNTAARTYTFQDRNGTIADDTDLALKANLANPTFSGTVTVPTPINTTDAVTKGYVDALSTGADTKISCRVGTTANITLSGTQTIDGVAVIVGDRVYVKNQTTASENGIYVVASGAWSRSSDADISAEVTTGMYSFISEGSTLAGTGWILATPDPIVLGTTNLTFTQFSGAGTYTAGNGLSLTGIVFSANLLVLADLVSAQTFATGIKTFLSGLFALRNVANTFSVFFSNSVTANRTVTLPDKAGTMAMLDDITGQRAAATNKTTIVNADEVFGGDSASSFSLIRTTWTDVKAFLKTYFDSIYAALAGSISQAFAVLQLEIGHATDTTLTRVSAGKIAIEGVEIPTISSIDTQINKTFTAPIIVGAINAQTGTTYTLILTDQSKLVTLTNASAIAVTIPTNASVAFPIGTQIDFSQDGAGKVTFSGAGVTINSLSSLKSIGGQYVGATLKKTATDTWNLYGNLIA